MIDTPSAIAFKMLTTFKTNSKKVQTIVKRDGQKFIRKYKEKDAGIYVYALPHTSGVSWEYENTSKHYILDEKITFNIDNAWIEGCKGDTVRVYLKPGQTKMINIRNGKGAITAAGFVENLEFVVKPV